MNKSKNTESILLSDLQDLFSNKHKYFISQQKGHQGVPNDGEGNQGEYNETIKYYQHPGLPEGIFMQEVYHTDSYGDGQSIDSIMFVKGKAKTITVYEPIS
jgi:hypothetical protein